MNHNEFGLIVLFVWVVWFFCGGIWAFVKLIWSSASGKGDKWSGFKSMFVWAIINLVGTFGGIYYFLEMA